MISNHIPFTG